MVLCVMLCIGVGYVFSSIFAGFICRWVVGMHGEHASECSVGGICVLCWSRSVFMESGCGGGFGSVGLSLSVFFFFFSASCAGGSGVYVLGEWVLSLMICMLLRLT